jgi:hypothetical protein
MYAQRLLPCGEADKRQLRSPLPFLLVPGKKRHGSSNDQCSHHGRYNFFCGQQLAMPHKRSLYLLGERFAAMHFVPQSMRHTALSTGMPDVGPTRSITTVSRMTSTHEQLIRVDLCKTRHATYERSRDCSKRAVTSRDQG